MPIRVNTPQYGSIFFNGDTIADLRSMPIRKIRPGYAAITSNRVTVGDNLGALFVWNAVSTMTAVNIATFPPAHGLVGREAGLGSPQIRSATSATLCNVVINGNLVGAERSRRRTGIDLGGDDVRSPSSHSRTVCAERTPDF